MSSRTWRGERQPTNNYFPVQTGSSSGVPEAWDTAFSARSALRRAEHRVTESDRLSEEPLSYWHTVPVDRVQSFKSIDSHNGDDSEQVFVDKFGRTSYMKQKQYNRNEDNRKISRLEDKYVDNDQRYTRSTLGESNRFEPPERDRQSSTGRSASHPANPSSHSSRTAEPSSVQSYLVGDSIRQPSVHSRASELSALSGSTAEHAVPMRYLNNIQTREDRMNEFQSRFGGTKLTHVDVTVPGSSSAKNATKALGPTNGAGIDSRAPPSVTPMAMDWTAAIATPAGAKRGMSIDELIDSTRRKRAAAANANAAVIDNGSSSQVSEVLRRQREEAAKLVEDEDEAYDDDHRLEMVTADDRLQLSRRTRHSDNEPIVPKQPYELHQNPSVKAPTRKVTTTVKTPAYKGFSEATKQAWPAVSNVPAHPQQSDNKATDAARRQRTSKSPEHVTDHGKPKARIVAVAKPTKQNAITPSSWRAGQKLVRRELGPDRPSKSAAVDTEQRSDQLPPHLPLDSASVDDVLDRLMVDKPSEPESDVKDKGEKDEAKKSAPRKTINVDVLSDGARAVLNDVDTHERSSSSESEDEDAEHQSNKKSGVARSATSPSRRARAKSDKNSSKAAEKVVKVRHYDEDAVRNFMVKKKEKERQQKLKQEAEERQKREKKEQALKNLQRPPQQKHKPLPAKAASEQRSFPGGMATFTIDKDPVTGNNRFLKLGNSESDKENSQGGTDGHSDESVTRETEDIIRRSRQDTRSQPPVSHARDSRTASSRVTEAIDEIRDGVDRRTVSAPPVTRDSPAVRAAPSVSATSGQDLLQQLTLSTGLSREDMIRKFAEQTQSTRDDRRTPSSLPDRVPLAQPTAKPDVSRRKEEMIRSITAYSDTLKSRLQIETEKLRLVTQGEFLLSGSLPEDVPYQGRMNRLGGRIQENDNVSYDLPGVLNAGALTRQREAKSRKAVDERKEKRGDAVDRKPASQVNSSSLNSALAAWQSRNQSAAKPSVPSSSVSAKIGAGLLESGYCAGTSTNLDLGLPMTGPARPQSVQLPVSLDWDKPDDMNFFNIYMRRLREAGGDGRTVSAGQPVVSGVQAQAPGDSSVPLTYHAIFSKPSATQSLPTRESERTKSPSSESASEASTVSVSNSLNDESDGRQRAAPKTSAKAADRAKVTEEHDDDRDNTITSSLDLSNASDASSVRVDDEDAAKPPPMMGQARMGDTRGMVGYSPAVLSQRLTAALHQLESTDESLRQLTEIDRVRAVSLAQQETVSLAQILKARQLQQQTQLNDIQVKAHEEMLRAQRDLEETRRREEVVSAQSRLAAEERAALVRMDAQEKVMRARLEAEELAARSRLEATAGHLLVSKPPVPVKITDRSAQFSQQSASVRSDSNSRDEQSTQSQASDISDSDTTPVPSPKRSASRSSRQSDKEDVKSMNDIVTASDASGKVKARGKGKDNTSIRTESDAEELESAAHSRTESVSEDINSEKANDAENTAELETSMAEDFERSMREVLPSEGQRKKLKHSTSQSHTISEDSQSHPASTAGTSAAGRRLSFGEESFEKFSLEMMMQYMQSEELRAQHQATLLKLREKALKEKTKAELAWIQQQKQSLKNNKVDEVYPQLKERQRGLLRRQKQEEEEIKRLKAAFETASEERKRMLLQSRDIISIKKSTQQVLSRLRHKRLPSVNSEVAAFSSESNVSSEASNVAGDKDTTSKLDTSEAPSSPTAEQKSLQQQIKRMKLDEKHLTAREQLLHQRKKKLEELMEWKRRLDEEEARVHDLEESAMKAIHSRKQDKPSPATSAERGSDKPPLSARSAPGDTIASEIDAVSTARSKAEVSTARSLVTEKEPSTARSQITSGSVKTARDDSDDQSRSSTDDVSESISEEISGSKTSNKRSGDSSKASTVKSATANYSEDTFDSAPPSHAVSTKREVKTTDKPTHRAEPASDDLISMTGATSDVSEAEARLKMLSETLEKLKEEANTLKKAKKSYREQLSNEEVALTKKIESYNAYISHAKAEVERHSTREAKRADVPEKRKESEERHELNVKVPEIALGSIAEESEHSSKSVHHAKDKDIPAIAQATPRDVPTMPLDEVADELVPLTARTDRDVSEDIRTDLDVDVAKSVSKHDDEESKAKGYDDEFEEQSVSSSKNVSVSRSESEKKKKEDDSERSKKSDVSVSRSRDSSDESSSESSSSESKSRSQRSETKKDNKANDKSEEVDEDIEEVSEVASLRSSSESDAKEDDRPALFIDLHAAVEHPAAEDEGAGKEAGREEEEGIWQAIESKSEEPLSPEEEEEKTPAVISAAKDKEVKDEVAADTAAAKTGDKWAKVESTKEVLAEKLADNVLLKDAIDQIIAIQKAKAKKEVQQEQKKEHAVAEDADHVSTPAKREDTHGGASLTSLSDLPDLSKPSADKKAAAAAMSKLYEDIDLGEEWMEEEDIFGHPPPPYSQSSQQRAAPHPDLKLDLSQLDTKRQVPEKVVPVVPHNESEVRQLVNSSLDVFWEKRRYGESWQGVVPPSSYLAPDVPVIGVAATEKAEASRKAYKSLVFDLTSEILTDLYSEEADDGGDKPWVPQSTAALRGIGRKAPTTLPDVRPLVGDQVSRLLGVHQTLGRPAVVPKVVVTRRRPDAVDRVLYQELQEEEPNWVTYDSDELDVKLQLSDAIMDLLLAETIACVTDVAGKKLR